MAERRGPPSIDGMFTLKIDNISFRTTPELLKEKFSPYGEIGDVYIPRNFGNNEPRGFAFVRYLDKRDAEDAQRALDGSDLDGREITIQEAKERRPDNPRESMSNRGGLYGGSRNDRGRSDMRGGNGYRDRDNRGGGRDSRDRGGDRDRGDHHYHRRGDRDRGSDRRDRGSDRDRANGSDRGRSPSRSPAGRGGSSNNNDSRSKGSDRSRSRSPARSGRRY